MEAWGFLPKEGLEKCMGDLERVEGQGSSEDGDGHGLAILGRSGLGRRPTEAGKCRSKTKSLHPRPDRTKTTPEPCLTQGRASNPQTIIHESCSLNPKS